jgi:ABC-type lipoprotein export system ATPase subunit
MTSDARMTAASLSGLTQFSPARSGSGDEFFLSFPPRLSGAQSITGSENAQWANEAEKLGRTLFGVPGSCASPLAQCPVSRAQSYLMEIITLQNVSKYYLTDGQQVRALEGISLEVNHGEFVALMGRSGCGKSTLLNLAGAMDFPTSGTVLLDGQDTRSLNDAGLTKLRREKVGFVFQSFQLLHTLSVFENVELPLLLAGKANARQIAREKLADVELVDLGDRFPHQLSGGQMQRVGIARALVQSPSVLLADEPTGNLDTFTGNVILKLLQRLTREMNTATIMATHSAEAAALADTVVCLRDGKIQEISRR